VVAWRRVLVVAVVDAVLFLLSGVTAHSTRHSGTISNVLWVDFLIGVLILLALTVAALVQSALAIRR
jgi:prepilin-type processing-associated H-X9-DG protein